MSHSVASRRVQFFVCASSRSQWSQSEADEGVTCSLWPLVGTFASSSLEVSYVTQVKLVQTLVATQRFSAQTKCFCSLLAGNKDNPFSSQPLAGSTSLERVMLHWVSLCCLDRSCKPRLVGHMVFGDSGLICIHKHQVLFSRSCAT